MCEFGQESKETETDELGETRPASASVMFHFLAHKQMGVGVKSNGKEGEDKDKRAIEIHTLTFAVASKCLSLKTERKGRGAVSKEL